MQIIKIQKHAQLWERERERERDFWPIDEEMKP